MKSMFKEQWGCRAKRGDVAESLDFIFADGNYAERDVDRRRKVILVDLRLRKVGGIEVLKSLGSTGCY